MLLLVCQCIFLCLDVYFISSYNLLIIIILFFFNYLFHSFKSNLEKDEQLKSKVDKILGGRVGNKTKGQSVCFIFIYYTDVIATYAGII